MPPGAHDTPPVVALRLVMGRPSGRPDEARRTDVLTEVAPEGWLEEGPDAPPIPTPEGEVPPPPPGHVRYTVYATPDRVEETAARLEDLGPASLICQPVDPDWRERWKLFFQPFRISDRLAVRPPWADPDEGPGVELVIDPGMAFGTGHHETTRLCLEALDALLGGPEPPAELLDVGCGSGILSIAALRLGARRAVAVDIDADSVRATSENAEANSVVVEVSGTPVGEVGQTFPLVIANILASILQTMAEDIAPRVAPGGRLMLSGALEEQADELAARYEALGLRRIGQARQGRWVRLDLERSL